MTIDIDKVIEHELELADHDCYGDDQLKEREYHEQIALWLKDYKRLKNMSVHTYDSYNCDNSTKSYYEDCHHPNCGFVSETLRSLVE